ncbi:hypothetical protein [Ewingella americana]|jgi:hypothetical protein
MSNSGRKLIDTILSHKKLMGILNCPAVSVEIGHAIYGKVQNDLSSGEVIKKEVFTQGKINNLLGFIGANSETAVWHFLLEGVRATTIHHFVVIPWYQHEHPWGRVYTVLMAYEGKYSLDQYVSRKLPAPTGCYGYKTVWTATELGKMFSDLLTHSNAWEQYFGLVGQSQANKISCWKYKVISVESAIANVNRYISIAST